MKMYFSLQKNVFLSPDRFLQILKAFPPGVWSQIGRKFIPFKLLDRIDLSKTNSQINVVLMILMIVMMIPMTLTTPAVVFADGQLL